MVENTTLTTIANQATYVLDSRIDGRRISKMNNETDDDHVVLDDLAAMLWSDPTPTEGSSPYSFAFQSISRVVNQPTSASVVTLVSSSSTDVSKVIIINGLNSSGIFITESVSLDGADATTPVVSTNTFLEVESIVKEGTTAGTITATANAGVVTVVSIGPYDLVYEAPLVRFYLVPDSVITLRYYFYKKVRKMNSVYDIPTIPEQFQWDILMNGVLAFAHNNEKDYSIADKYEAKMEQAIRKMVTWGKPINVGSTKIPPYGERSLKLRFDYDSLDSYGTP